MFVFQVPNGRLTSSYLENEAERNEDDELGGLAREERERAVRGEHAAGAYPLVRVVGHELEPVVGEYEAAGDADARGELVVALGHALVEVVEAAHVAELEQRALVVLELVQVAQVDGWRRGGRVCSVLVERRGRVRHGDGRCRRRCFRVPSGGVIFWFIGTCL